MKTTIPVFKQNQLNQELLKSAKLGDVFRIKKLTEDGADIFFNDQETLKISIEHERIDVVKFLIKRGANIDLAKKTQHKKIKKWAFSYIKEKQYNEKLVQQASDGSLEEIKELILQGADLHFNSEQALQFAANNGKLEIVKYIIENGATNRGKDRALKGSAYYNHLQTFTYLLEQGANKHVDNEYCFNFVGEKSNIDIPMYLINTYPNEYMGINFFSWSIKNDQLEILKLLLKQMDVTKYFKENSKNEENLLKNDLLQYSINIQKKDAIEILLKNGADIHLNKDEMIKNFYKNKNQPALDYMIFDLSIKQTPEISKYIKDKIELKQLFDKKEMNAKLKNDLNILPVSKKFKI